MAVMAPDEFYVEIVPWKHGGIWLYILLTHYSET